MILTVKDLRQHDMWFGDEWIVLDGIRQEDDLFVFRQGFFMLHHIPIGITALGFIFDTHNGGAIIENGWHDLQPFLDSVADGTEPIKAHGRFAITGIQDCCALLNLMMVAPSIGFHHLIQIISNRHEENIGGIRFTHGPFAVNPMMDRLRTGNAFGVDLRLIHDTGKITETSAIDRSKQMSQRFGGLSQNSSQIRSITVRCGIKKIKLKQISGIGGMHESSPTHDFGLIPRGQNPKGSLQMFVKRGTRMRKFNSSINAFERLHHLFAVWIQDIPILVYQRVNFSRHLRKGNSRNHGGG
mmetsp:Transcript_6547/g.10824  ORF Transcript_6547/g.10824 Transcript_6547/m.10824 type:complete len:298 (-) Transcript_6547:518-1411(-)